MSIVNSRLTRGLYTATGLNPDDVHAFTVLSKMGASGEPSDDINDYATLSSKAYYESNLGVISLKQLPDASGVEVTVTADFDLTIYRGFFALVRGSYEYKRSTVSPYVEILAHQSTSMPTDLVFTDTTATAGEIYYYSVLAFVGTPSLPGHIGYNPSTGFASAYRYKNYGHAGFMFKRLPVEWQQLEDDFSERFMSIFGQLFDSIRTDVEANIFLSKDVDNIEEKQLSHLASLIGWEVNRELDELKQREEIKSVVAAYKKKGRNNAIEFLVQLVTGWETEFESGFRRLLVEPAQGFDPSDAYAIANKGLPERTTLDEALGASSGAANQTFALSNAHTRAISVEVEDLVLGGFDKWLQVTPAALASAAATDEYYAVTEDATFIATVVFGDGVNGAIPTTSANIQASYKHGGDVLLYTPEPGKWKNSAGLRVLLTRTPSASTFDQVLIDKVQKIINRMKASYALYELMIVGTHDESLPTSSDTHVSDVNKVVALLKRSTQDHRRNDDGYKRPVKPI